MTLPLRIASLRVAASTLSAPAAAQSFDAFERAARAREPGAPGRIATFRNQTLTVTATFGSFRITGYGG